MERHRYCDRSVPQDVDTGASHSSSELRGDRSASAVLQGVDDVAKRARIGSNRATRGETGTTAAATRASCFRHADDAPGRQRIAALRAERRLKRLDAVPAGAADRSARGLVERNVTGRARRREQDGDGTVGKPAESRRSSGSLPRSRSVRRRPTGARGHRTHACSARRCAR
jgi:hypothetical protein